MIQRADSNGEQRLQKVAWKSRAGPVALLRRTVATLLTARQVHNSIRHLEKEIKQNPNMNEDERKRRWDDLHKRNAQRAVQHIQKYRGFLTKVGQGASTKAGDLPEPWISELQALQDQMPISPFEDIERTIRGDLGRSVKEVFTDFQQKPIASASVAQAHVAYLRTNRQKVCVKVQHEGVAKMMGVDLATVEYLIKYAAKHHSDAPDLTGLIQEWRRASKEEVDFRLEAENMARAKRALQGAFGEAVGCPEPVLRYCGRRTLTMAFIEGWKITQLHHLPPATDREALASTLVDAWAYLAFEEGLIHGDPHPGNIFVQPAPVDGDAQQHVRPVFLDWGIVKRADVAERNAMARAVVAVLSQDRGEYMTALRALGFEFYDNLEAQDTDELMNMLLWSLRDAIPHGAHVHIKEEMARVNLDDIEEDVEAMQRSKKNVINKVPGTVLFFLRALEMLQQVSGTLDAAVPFAELILRRAMQLLSKRNSQVQAVPHALTASRCRSEMERDVRAKLDEMMAAGLILGAQVAVLVDEEPRSTWCCDVAVGRRSLLSGPLSEATLLPLLDVGQTVLIPCLLSALTRPTATGQKVGLDTTVARVWPEYARRGKETTTIGQLLRHRGGLTRPFPRDMTLKMFSSEKYMEDILAATPKEMAAGGNGPACYVLGNAAATLLRRIQGCQTTAAALRSCLKPLGLQDDIVYGGVADERMARFGRRPVEQLPISKVFKWLEERQKAKQQRTVLKDTILGWRDLAGIFRDPLLVNNDEMRTGQCCMAGRGLRGTARALCHLLGSGMMPAELLEQSRSQPKTLAVESLQEWEDLGRCLDVGTGWQLFSFKGVEGNDSVLAHGHADGCTGSLALRLPGASVVILLTSVDEQSRHVGRELVSVIAKHVGLAPTWHLEPPKLPHQVAADAKTSKQPCAAGQPSALPGRNSGRASASNARAEDDLARRKIEHLETQVKRLFEAVNQVNPDIALEDASAPRDLDGDWASSQIEGLDALLERFQVPAVARAFAGGVRRSLHIEGSGRQILIESAMTVAGRTLDESIDFFEVGEPFGGEQQLGGAYVGVSSWVPCGDTAGLANSSSSHQPPDAEESGRTLLVKKTFDLQDREMTVEEHFKLAGDGRLIVDTILRGAGTKSVELRSPSDVDRFLSSLDIRTMLLRREVQLGGSQAFMQGGKLVEPLPPGLLDAMRWRPGVSSTSESVPLPCTINLLYDDIRCRSFYDRKGGNGLGKAAAAARGASLGHRPLPVDGSPASSVSCGATVLRGTGWLTVGLLRCCWGGAVCCFSGCFTCTPVAIEFLRDVCQAFCGNPGDIRARRGSEDRAPLELPRSAGMTWTGMSTPSGAASPSRSLSSSAPSSASGMVRKKRVRRKSSSTSQASSNPRASPLQAPLRVPPETGSLHRPVAPSSETDSLNRFRVVPRSEAGSSHRSAVGPLHRFPAAPSSEAGSFHRFPAAPGSDTGSHHRFPAAPSSNSSCATSPRRPLRGADALASALEAAEDAAAAAPPLPAASMPKKAIPGRRLPRNGREPDPAG